MGANLTHGRTFEKKIIVAGNGQEVHDILPVDGGYDWPTYGAVREMVDYCAARGIKAEMWPIYYGVNASDVSLEDAYDRSRSLREAVGRLPPEDIRRLDLLSRVHTWLQAGESICILE